MKKRKSFINTNLLVVKKYILQDTGLKNLPITGKDHNMHLAVLLRMQNDILYFKLRITHKAKRVHFFYNQQLFFPGWGVPKNITFLTKETKWDSLMKRCSLIITFPNTLISLILLIFMLDLGSTIQRSIRTFPSTEKCRNKHWLVTALCPSKWHMQGDAKNLYDMDPFRLYNIENKIRMPECYITWIRLSVHASRQTEFELTFFSWYYMC